MDLKDFKNFKIQKGKIKDILNSTFVKVTGAVLVISFILSGFFFFDFYETQYHKIIGYYWVHKGDKAFKKQDLHTAIYDYEIGIYHHPWHYRAMYNLANIYVVYEDYHQALKNYEKALMVRPDYDVARIDYAIILSQVYKTDEAIEQYEKVLRYQPKLVKIPFLVDRKKSYVHNRGVAYYNMGLAYKTKSLLAGLTKEASRYYLKKATESYEQSAEILNTYSSIYNLALTHQLLKNNNQAAMFYCKAIELAPLEYEAHFNYAVLLNDVKDYQGAQEEFQKAGLLLDSKGESSKTRYIYTVLNDVNSKIALFAPKDYYTKLNEKLDKEDTSKYKAGKLVLDTTGSIKKDKETMKYFSTCANSDKFQRMSARMSKRWN